MHPFHEHRQTKKEHSRVSKITKGYASGGAVNRTEDDRKVRKMSASQEREVDPEGGVSPHRMDRPKRAKGGKVKSKGNSRTIVNVITGGHPAGGAVPPMPVAPPPPAGIAGAAMAPPMGKPPMPPSGAGGPPMPMRARGGGVNKGGKVYEAGKRAGTQVTHDTGKSDLVDQNRKKVVTFASGGRVRTFEATDKVAPATKLPGGSSGGEARLAKAHRAARK